MKWIVIAFVLAALQNYFATLEVYAISKLQASKAALLAFLNSSTAYLIIVILVVESNKLWLVSAGIAGDVLATWYSLKRLKRGKF
jgi:hypothetical protein